jgi:hypothetical protein
MGELNYKNNAVYDIEAPDIPGDRDKRIRVLLHTDEHIVLDNVAEHSLTVYRTEYHLSLRNMVQDFELTLTAADNTPVGAMIYIDFANATGEETPHTLTVKAGESTVAAVATSLESTTACMFMYTGNGFVLMAAGKGGAASWSPDSYYSETNHLVTDGNYDGLGAIELKHYITRLQLGVETFTHSLDLHLDISELAVPDGARVLIDFNTDGSSGTVSVEGNSITGHTELVYVDGVWLVSGSGEFVANAGTRAEVADLSIVMEDGVAAIIKPEAKISCANVDESQLTQMTNLTIDNPNAEDGDILFVVGGGINTDLMQGCASKVFVFKQGWIEVLSVPMAAGGQGSMEAVWWDLSAEQSKVVGGNSESEVHVSISGTCGGMASLTYGGNPKDGYKLYLTNTDPQNNTSDTVDVMGKQVPLSDLMGTRVFVYANGMWN